VGSRISAIGVGTPLSGEPAGTFPDRQHSPNLAEQAYQHLKRLILARELLGGTGLSEARLASELSVSRTPMREALVRLAGEGLLEKSDDGIYRVRTVSIREFFECMEVREALECYALERAIPLVNDTQLKELSDQMHALPVSPESDMAHWHFDNRFHAFFAQAAGNSALVRAIQRERMVARLFRISSPFHRSHEIVDEHQRILDAVIRRDVTSALVAMRQHLRNLQSETRSAIEREAYLTPAPDRHA
jgi:DNA-binding GntR family transcriptional regulator